MKGKWIIEDFANAIEQFSSALDKPATTDLIRAEGLANLEGFILNIFLSVSIKCQGEKGMKQAFTITLTFVLLGLTIRVHAVGDAEAGKAKAQQCTSCHTADGNSIVPVYPKLAGQHAYYLAEAMKAYRDKIRNNSIMLTIAEGYLKNDADIEDLAAHFASQKSNACADEQETNQVKAVKAKLKACSECHFIDGNSQISLFPKLAGQHEAYLIKTMQDYKQGIRKHEQMSQMALLFGNDTDIENIAAYFASQKADSCQEK